MNIERQSVPATSGQPEVSLSAKVVVQWLGRAVAKIAATITFAAISPVLCTINLIQRLINPEEPQIRFGNMGCDFESLTVETNQWLQNNKLTIVDDLDNDQDSLVKCLKFLKDAGRDDGYENIDSILLENNNGDLKAIPLKNKVEGIISSDNQNIKARAKILAYYLNKKRDINYLRKGFDEFIDLIKNQSAIEGYTNNDCCFVSLLFLSGFDKSTLCKFYLGFDFDFQILIQYSMNPKSYQEYYISNIYKACLKFGNVDQLSAARALVSLMLDVKHKVETFKDKDAASFVVKYESILNKYKDVGEDFEKNYIRGCFDGIESENPDPKDLFMLMLVVASEQCVQEKSVNQRIIDEQPNDELSVMLASVYSKDGDCEAERQDLISYLEEKTEPSSCEEARATAPVHLAL